MLNLFGPYRKGVCSSNAAGVCEVGPDKASGCSSLKASTTHIVQRAKPKAVNSTRRAVRHKAHAVRTVCACVFVCARACCVDGCVWVRVQGTYMVHFTVHALCINYWCMCC
jgi:hypothetical protein